MGWQEQRNRILTKARLKGIYLNTAQLHALEDNQDIIAIYFDRIYRRISRSHRDQIRDAAYARETRQEYAARQALKPNLEWHDWHDR